MSRPPPQKAPASQSFELGVFGVLIGMAFALPGYGQTSSEEHASHHATPDAGATPKAPGGMAPAMPPGQDTPASMAPAMPAGAGAAPGGMAGMAGMAKMMEGMGKAPPKELYPTLMDLPNMTPDQREAVRVQAQERLHSGVAVMSQAADRLTQAVERDDYAAMQAATVQMREGLSRFDSGVAAERALAEGKPPPQVALQWFKNEMNLEPPQGVEARTGLFGITPFHLFTMVLLIAFSLAMVAMYFFKMRRAAALFERIETDSGSPPPGSAPPLAGTPGPPAADAVSPSAPLTT